MDGSINPVMRRKDEYSLGKLSVDSKPHEPFWEFRQPLAR
ncbi:hypothetical protein F383_17827 [Gossypium arboreum]|uniref:Uncharacterized protein n=1 Tax=Gossypium arboreum TaxID=29729 RepID=A0A0B0NTF4_GOSAR|nr:hypothetical protein F383_17827 [Gossypium arboreum]